MERTCWIPDHWWMQGTIFNDALPSGISTAKDDRGDCNFTNMMAYFVEYISDVLNPA